MNRSYSAYTEVEVDIPVETIKQWAAEIHNEAHTEKAEARLDLDNIYIALRKHGELALAGRLLNIIREDY